MRSDGGRDAATEVTDDAPGDDSDGAGLVDGAVDGSDVTSDAMGQDRPVEADAQTDVAGGGIDGAAGSDSAANTADRGPTTMDGGSNTADGGTVPSIGRNVGCAPSTTLWSGTETLIDAFPTKDGVIVVTVGAVSVVSRMGAVTKSYVPPRPLTAAAFDGALLALADAAFVTVMTPALESRGMIMLKESCASAVMVGAQRLVCGPMNDWDRIFYTYDLVQLSLVGTSPKYTYKGIPMRRVPGLDNFVTYGTSGSPADYSLFRIDALGPAYFLGESPYHGDFAVGPTYAFAGRPATHLVTSEGLMLKLFTPECPPDGMAVLGSGCFVKDGNIGTLWAGEMFQAMTTDEERDIVYGVVGTLDTFRRLTCTGPCKVQRIDAAQRLILGQREHTLRIGQVITTRHDTQCQMLLLGYRTNDTTPVTRLDLLEHGGT